MGADTGADCAGVGVCTTAGVGTGAGTGGVTDDPCAGATAASEDTCVAGSEAECRLTAGVGGNGVGVEAAKFLARIASARAWAAFSAA